MLAAGVFATASIALWSRLSNACSSSSGSAETTRSTGAQPLDAPNHLGHRNGSQHGTRKIGKLPVAIHEMHQANTAALDRIHCIHNFARRLGRTSFPATWSTAQQLI